MVFLGFLVVGLLLGLIALLVNNWWSLQVTNAPPPGGDPFPNMPSMGLDSRRFEAGPTQSCLEMNQYTGNGTLLFRVSACGTWRSVGVVPCPVWRGVLCPPPPPPSPPLSNPPPHPHSPHPMPTSRACPTLFPPAPPPVPQAVTWRW